MSGSTLYAEVTRPSLWRHHNESRTRVDAGLAAVDDSPRARNVTGRGGLVEDVGNGCRRAGCHGNGPVGQRLARRVAGTARPHGTVCYGHVVEVELLKPRRLVLVYRVAVVGCCYRDERSV